jgi:hypothetical protein
MIEFIVPSWKFFERQLLGPARYPGVMRCSHNGIIWVAKMGKTCVFVPVVKAMS